MAEYIEREKLPPRKKRGFYLDDNFNAGWNACLDKVNSIPAADVVERKVGKWCADYDYSEYDFDGSTPLTEPRKFQDGWQCSLCGGYSPSETNYCPNCGAKMSGDDEDEEPPKEELK